MRNGPVAPVDYRLRVVPAVTLDKQDFLWNIDATYATVRDCSERVFADLRPLAIQILLAVAGIIKGGKPAHKGVLSLVNCAEGNASSAG